MTLFVTKEMAWLCLKLALNLTVSVGRSVGSACQVRSGCDHFSFARGIASRKVCMASYQSTIAADAAFPHCSLGSRNRGQSGVRRSVHILLAQADAIEVIEHRLVEPLDELQPHPDGALPPVPQKNRISRQLRNPERLIAHAKAMGQIRT
jgi:hypothetical protein